MCVCVSVSSNGTLLRCLTAEPSGARRCRRLLGSGRHWHGRGHERRGGLLQRDLMLRDVSIGAVVVRFTFSCFSKSIMNIINAKHKLKRNENNISSRTDQIKTKRSKFGS